jgi:uncharacterized protein YecA (UPF0149 family)
MNCNDVLIYDPEMMKHFRALWDESEKKTGVPNLERDQFIQMEVEPTEKQLARTPQHVGRNEPCPCGSGLKFKKCHLILNYRSTDKRLVK